MKREVTTYFCNSSLQAVSPDVVALTTSIDTWESALRRPDNAIPSPKWIFPDPEELGESVFDVEPSIFLTLCLPASQALHDPCTWLYQLDVSLNVDPIGRTKCIILLFLTIYDESRRRNSRWSVKINACKSGHYRGLAPVLFEASLLAS